MFVQPLFIMVQIFLILRCIRMVKAHCGYFLYLLSLDVYLKVFCNNIVEHRCQIVRRRIHPVGINLHPVLEIPGLFRNERQHGAHYFQQLHVAVKRIFIAPLHQHLGNFFDDLRHSASIS